MRQKSPQSALATAFVLLLWGCTPPSSNSTSNCPTPGATKTCPCTAQTGGFKVCGADGDWSPCQCPASYEADATAPIDTPIPTDVPCIGKSCADAPRTPTCIPNCTGKQCGPDGCGNPTACGTCPDPQQCTAQYTCTGPPNNECIPSCVDKQCGDNGCGDPSGCGTCPDGQTCGPQNACLNAGCVPSCAAKQCGDDGCGNPTACGNCPQGTNCENYQCTAGPCVPSCINKQCGDNGCGDPNGCGICPAGQNCAANQCQGGPAPNNGTCGICAPATNCGADPNYPSWCAGANCSGISYEGTCLGDIVAFCDQNVLYSIDCLFLGGGQSVCGFNPEAGFFDCIAF